MEDGIIIGGTEVAHSLCPLHREEHARGLPVEAEAATSAHRLAGPRRCGIEHRRAAATLLLKWLPKWLPKPLEAPREDENARVLERIQ